MDFFFLDRFLISIHTQIHTNFMTLFNYFCIVFLLSLHTLHSKSKMDYKNCNTNIIYRDNNLYYKNMDTFVKLGDNTKKLIENNDLTKDMVDFFFQCPEEERNVILLYNMVTSAIKYGNYKAVKWLIGQKVYPLDVNLTVGKGTPFLFIALQEEKCNIAKLLIDNGADVSKGHPYSGATPVQLAIIGNHFFVLEDIIKRGFDINSQRYGFGSPFKILFNTQKNAGNRFLMFKFLLKNGCDINLVKGGVMKLVTLSILDDEMDILDYLLENTPKEDLTIDRAYIEDIYNKMEYTISQWKNIKIDFSKTKKKLMEYYIDNL